MREKLKIRRDRKTQNMKFFRQSLLKKWRVQKRRLKRSRTNYHFPIFFEKKKEKTQRNIFQGPTNKKNIFFSKRPCKRKQFKKHGVL